MTGTDSPTYPATKNKVKVAARSSAGEW